MNGNKESQDRLLRGASRLAISFNRGFHEITKKPEFAEYFHHTDSESKKLFRKELLGYISYALAIMLGENGYVRDPEEFQLLMEEFTFQAGNWDQALYERVDRYRELDARRGGPLGSASALEFARAASKALAEKPSEEDDVLLGLTSLGTLFLVNYISPILSEVFHTASEEECAGD